MPTPSKRRLVQAALLSLVALAGTNTLAQAWPSKPVRMIVPAAAALHAAVVSMSDAELDFRGLSPVRDPLLAWLAARR